MEAIKELFKKYSDYTALTEGHYEYLMDEGSFKEAVEEFVKLAQKEINNQKIQDSIDINSWSK